MSYVAVAHVVLSANDHFIYKHVTDSLGHRRRHLEYVSFRVHFLFSEIFLEVNVLSMYVHTFRFKLLKKRETRYIYLLVVLEQFHNQSALCVVPSL